jgi:hypothetical protein
MPELAKIKELISISQLIKRWRLVKSKKLLIIRPNCPGDNYTTLFSFPSATIVKNKATAEGWTVTDLQGNNTNRSNVESNLNSGKPDFVIHYDHGSSFTLYGQNANAITPAIDDANVSLLSGCAVSTVSCESAAGLGPLAIASTSKAYLGYDELHWVHLWYLDKFMEASNAANSALLEGKTFQEAYDVAYQKYTDKWAELVGSDPAAAALLLHDRDHLTLLGDPNARATGLRVVLIPR